MPDIVIKAENLSKSYIIGHEKREHYLTLRDVAVNKARQIVDKTRQIFKGRQLIAGNEMEEFWALKNINFEIKQGDRIGIIGRNGAGKSTLLKILSRITEPTTGKIQIRGRVASLLEVGTGFHPELTGRENIFLNGAILGMSRVEIKKKFDEIVYFSGVEKFLDTPVKRYSSGMYVRLAFAVAAHMEPEILIVDEVLAVGDAEFQKKCLGKMEDVSKKEGRTVLFVSHNIPAVETLCDRGLLLDKGFLTFSGNSHETINSYLKSNNYNNQAFYTGNGIIKKAEIIFQDIAIKYNSSIQLKVKFESNFKIKNLVLGIVIKDIYDTAVIAINNKHYSDSKLHLEDIFTGYIVVSFPNFQLLPGNYKINLFLGDTTTDLEIVEDAIFFNIEESSFTKTINALDYHLNKTFIENVLWEYKA